MTTIYRHTRSPETPPRRPDRPRFGDEAGERQPALKRWEGKLRRAARALLRRLERAE